jgi:hypothetical protein
VYFVAAVSGNYSIEAYNYWGFAGAYRLTVSNDYGPGGRPIPAGYELRTITCSVDVFDMPGGNPVAGARIIGGQTWYVNPVPEEAPDGSSWTEIYASGTTDGYIPTKCVG